MNYLRRNIIVFIVLISLSSLCQAGLLSMLAKSAKKVDAPDAKASYFNDIDLAVKKLDLPEDKIDSVLMAKLDANGDWRYTNTSEELVRNLDSLDQPLILLDKSSLPRDLTKLDSLPKNAVIHIRSGSSVFSLANEGGWVLKAGQAAIKVVDHGSLQKALWHFQSAWSPGMVRVVGAVESGLKNYTVPSGISVNNIVNAGSQLRGSTLVFTGKIRNGVIRVKGTDFDIENLRQQATKYDMSLVLLEDAAGMNPQKILKGIQQITPKSGVASTGDFLAYFSHSSKPTRQYYSVADSGRSQVLISRQALSQPSQTLSASGAAELVANVAQLGIRVAIYKPNQERQVELDSRFVYWLPNEVAIYLVFSIGLGFWGFSTSKQLLQRLWPTQDKGFYSHRILYMLVRGLRYILLFLMVIPVFGVPIFIYIAAVNTYEICRGIVILSYRFLRCLSWPFIWLYKQVRNWLT